MQLDRFGIVLGLLTLCTVVGCQGGAKNDAPAKSTKKDIQNSSEDKPKIVKKSMGNKSKPKEKKLAQDDRKSTKIVKKSFSSGSSNAFATKSFGGGSKRRTNLTKSVIGYAEESQEVNPTVVLWVFDETRSATKIREKVISELKQVKKMKFDSIVASYSAQAVTAHTSSPTSDSDTLKNALENVKSVDADEELTFAKLKEILTTNEAVKQSSRKSLICVLVTDESGDDAFSTIDGKPAVEAVINLCKQRSITLFAIGYAAPFGRETDLVEGTRPKTLYGPETAYAERVSLGMWNASTDIFRYDSGFGPWALEKLCRATGGRFLADRPAEKSMRLVSKMQSNWPAVTSRQFDDAVMAPYRPFYGSVEEYMTDVNSNSAKLALHNAAKLPYTNVFRIQDYEFRQESEAQLAREINMTQRVPAIIRPGLEKLYDTLRSGEKERDAVQSKRWQVSFDLAYGRVMANYVRVIGLNSMLAELKGGKTFADPQSTTWTLVPSDDVSTGTGNRKMADKAKLYLERVVNEHPNTPWALIAKKELESPMGWKWEESKR